MQSTNEFKVAMHKKLQELSSEYIDTDMLVDFCAAMIENGKGETEVYSQLKDRKLFL